MSTFKSLFVKIVESLFGGKLILIRFFVRPKLYNVFTKKK